MIIVPFTLSSPVARVLRVGLVLVLGLLVAACSADSFSPMPQGDESGDGGPLLGRGVADAGEEGGETLLPGSELAMAFVPAGTPLPLCGGGFSKATSIFHEGLLASPAACSCTCGTPEGVVCNMTLHASTVCSSGSLSCPGSTSISFEVRSDMSSLYAGGQNPCIGSTVSNPIAKTGSCTPQQNADKPTPTWKLDAQACEGSGILPSGFSRCVVSDTCDAAHPNKHVVAHGVIDTRSCSVCSCGEVSGVTCDGEASDPLGGKLPTRYDCPTMGTHYLTNGSWTYDAVTTGGSCGPSPSTASGDVEMDAPTTVCCE